MIKIDNLLFPDTSILSLLMQSRLLIFNDDKYGERL
jgi:hypothetical protein